jgi:cytolysin-activating lysine-acyltransferase
MTADHVAGGSKHCKFVPPNRPKIANAIWASVSEAVDAKIHEQVKAGVFPVRLQADDWASGKINWLLDVFAPTPQLVTAVVSNFRQVTKGDDLRVHPVVTGSINPVGIEKVSADA